MCKLGDIIVIKEFKNEIGQIISKHSFVVISDENNYIEGIKYDFVSNMMCSFHNENHKRKKLKHKENLLIAIKSVKGKNINSKDGYIKADQLYYFDKSSIEYKIIAHMEQEILLELINLITILDKERKIRIITTNLK